MKIIAFIVRVGGSLALLGLTYRDTHSVWLVVTLLMLSASTELLSISVSKAITAIVAIKDILIMKEESNG